MKACLSRLISYLGKPGSLRGTLKAVSPSVYCVNLGTLFCAQLWHIMKEYGETVFIWSPWLPPRPTPHPHSCLLNLKVTEVMTRTYQTRGSYLFLQRISSDICIEDIIYLSNELHARDSMSNRTGTGLLLSRFFFLSLLLPMPHPSWAHGGRSGANNIASIFGQRCSLFFWVASGVVLCSSVARPPKVWGTASVSMNADIIFSSRAPTRGPLLSLFEIKLWTL